MRALSDVTGKDQAGSGNRGNRADLGPLAACRLCGDDVVEAINLGVMALTGMFPKPDEKVPEGPLRLVRCRSCGLVQLGDRYDPAQLYGGDYGYRSGLNGAMVRHLQETVEVAVKRADAKSGDVVIDIGSNDGTLLNCYPEGMHRIGVDPNAIAFYDHYPKDAVICSELFSKSVRDELLARFGEAKIVTSIAMFYDLQDPVGFARDVMSILREDGIWVTEQSYLPAMVGANAYDTICHEHFEYYGLEQIIRIAHEADAKIIDVEFNDINGGSFAVSLAHSDSHFPACGTRLTSLLEQEAAGGFGTLKPLERLKAAADRQRERLVDLLKDLKGQTVIGYGASTKGNVLLQYCGIGPELLPAIVEINKDKFGRVTPGTGIPIIPEAEATEPDYLLVLPWHFRPGILERERAFIKRGGKLIFPLPEVEVVECPAR